MREWLVRARQQKKLTHEQVANEVGISRQYYSMIENGERSPSVNVSKKIALVLNFDWTIFFETNSNESCQRAT
ncbi:helix-turn-helix transcriptional regulator [Bacillus sp. AFS017336]|uniref:helix-turn-helix transcriptional regulator n=1 Tax=Bacillus sp. AFS017336 TaxID=2033489 RepID=UPI000BF11487|nr:helix-turn-helix transcriptional regulator [Bacillus sp. AFS017336]PEL12697.1 transcriptional regulator [Bacillus sp. AFS017336]